MERGPVLRRFSTTGMLQDVNKQVLGVRSIFRRPVTNALHVMLAEKRVDMIAEPVSERIHLPGVYVIHPQFVDVFRRIRGPSHFESNYQERAANKRSCRFHMAKLRAEEDADATRKSTPRICGGRDRASVWPIKFEPPLESQVVRVTH